MEAITQELARLQESKEKAVQGLAAALALPPEDRMPDVVELMKAENAKLDERITKFEDALLQHTGERQTEKKWDGAFMYSTWLRDKLGLGTPWEQYGFYTSAIGGSVYGMRQYERAYELAQYMKTGKEEHLIMSRCTELEAKHGRMMIERIKMRGAVAILGAPITWLAWRRAQHMKPVSKPK